MAHATVSGVYRKIKSRFATIAGVHRKIIKRFVVVGGVYKLAWSAFTKVKAIFNGYTVHADIDDLYSSTINTRYDLDASKSYSTKSDAICISKDGYYYLYGSTSFKIAYWNGTGLTDLTSYTKYVSTDYIKSTSVYEVKSPTTIQWAKFSADSKRLCYAIIYRTAASVYWSLALVFLKKNDSGVFEYEKDACLINTEMYADSTIHHLQISDDLSTVSCSYRKEVNDSLTAKVFKGSPSSGYTAIYTATTNYIYLDEEKAEYAVTNTGKLIRISGNTATEITTITLSGLEDLYFNYDRSLMYITKATTVYMYKISGTTATLMGSYKTGSSYSCEGIVVYDENVEGNALVMTQGTYGASDGSEYCGALHYAKLSKDANGCITGYTSITKLGSTIESKPKRVLTRFYSTTV